MAHYDDDRGNQRDRDEPRDHRGQSPQQTYSRGQQEYTGSRQERWRGDEPVRGGQSRDGNYSGQNGGRSGGARVDRGDTFEQGFESDHYDEGGRYRGQTSEDYGEGYRQSYGGARYRDTDYEGGSVPGNRFGFTGAGGRGARNWGTGSDYPGDREYRGDHGNEYGRSQHNEGYGGDRNDPSARSSQERSYDRAQGYFGESDYRGGGRREEQRDGNERANGRGQYDYHPNDTYIGSSPRAAGQGYYPNQGMNFNNDRTSYRSGGREGGGSGRESDRGNERRERGGSNRQQY